LILKLQDEHHKNGCDRVNFKEKANKVKNEQIGKFHVNGKNKPFYNSFILTDADCSGCRKTFKSLISKPILKKILKFGKIQNGCRKIIRVCKKCWQK
jgi:hypothetical protein